MSEQRLGRIEEKVDKIHDAIKSIDVTLAGQHVSLAEHIRRTELLETEVRPIKEHVAFMQACLRLIGAITVGLGLALTVKQLIG
jgi:hypothetical protein